MLIFVYGNKNKEKDMELVITPKEIRIKDEHVLTKSGMQLASQREPYTIIYTSNYEEKYKLNALRELRSKGKAECIKAWERGNYIDDPYGRMHRVGTISCSIWDLRKAFGVTEPLEKFLDYETNAFLKGEINTLF